MNILSTTKAHRRYLTDRLSKVSRSFAIVIPAVEQPLSDYLAVSYLICRVLDNIEDCTQPVAWRRTRFAEARTLLDAPDYAEEVLSSWRLQDWPGLTPDEEAVMGLPDGLPLWQLFAAMPAHVRGMISRWVTEMMVGMSEFVDLTQGPYTRRNGSVPVLSTVEDYNSYCYYVAGTVGRLATELMVAQFPVDDSVVERLLLDSEACGRGLQKTNIVKDFAKDIARGVCYLPDEWLQLAHYSPLALEGASDPWKQKVIGDVLGELRVAVNYVVQLPMEASGYRKACLLCLFPAYETLRVAADRQQVLFTSDHHVKMSRASLTKCIYYASIMATDNESILRRSQKLEHTIDTAFRI